MDIFDITDAFEKNINNAELENENLDQYINGAKEHIQALVSCTKHDGDVIYREQL